ncbi:MAG: SH3 domain-containing protein [Rhodothermaceae bacterium]|nr:SH3 domain-containing protein [Rhodothermaceae bacterium]
MSFIIRFSIVFLLGPVIAATFALSDLPAQPNPQSLFNEGNYHLEQQSYQDAIDKYREITALGYESGPLFLNLGISYTHLDSLGLAKYYYLKALGYRQSKDAAETGLRHVNMLLSQARPNLPVLPVAEFYDRLYFETGSMPFFLLSVLFINLAAAALIVTWFTPRFSGWLRTISILLLLMSIATLGTGFFVDSQANRYSRAILIYNDSVVREQPYIDAPVVASAHIGYTFTVDTHTGQGNDEWLYVRLSNGLEGWIPAVGIVQL